MRKIWLLAGFVLTITIGTSGTSQACDFTDFASNLRWCIFQGWDGRICPAAKNHDSDTVLKWMGACQQEQPNGGSIMKNAWACYYADQTPDEQSIWSTAKTYCGQLRRH